MAGALRILHCPTTVGGHPQGLSRAERELGCDSLSMTFRQNQFHYDTDIVLFGPGDGWAARTWKLARFILRALMRFDVLHYNYGQTLYTRPHGPTRMLSMLDARLARALGRVVAVTYLGTDARQGAYCRKHYAVHIGQGDPGYFSDARDEAKRRSIARLARHADLIYFVNPDLAHALPERARFMPYATVNPREWRAVGISAALAEPHVIHAPSHRRIKGTDAILAAVERLKAEGVAFRFTLVEGFSNAEARKLYETADLLVEQLYLGFYGVLATECMALGKPVMSYIRQEDLQYLPEGMAQELPVISITEDTLYATLKEWLTVRKGELAQKGMAGRRYVEKWHDPRIIAERTLRDYREAMAGKRRL